MTPKVTRSQDSDSNVVPAEEKRGGSFYASLMAMMADNGCDASKLRELLAVRKDFMDDEAKQAFNAAVVQFQQRVKIVARGDSNNGRPYARIDRIWREIRPLLDECGLAVTWESVKSAQNICVLDGHLRHARGHAQPLHHEMPLPEEIRGQNATQRAGSGETYCKRYALCAALGIQTGDDDDGGSPSMPAQPARVAVLRQAIKDRGKDEAKAREYLGVATLEDATADQIEQLIQTLKRQNPMDAQ